MQPNRNRDIPMGTSTSLTPKTNAEISKVTRRFDLRGARNSRQTPLIHTHPGQRRMPHSKPDSLPADKKNRGAAARPKGGPMMPCDDSRLFEESQSPIRKVETSCGQTSHETSRRAQEKTAGVVFIFWMGRRLGAQSAAKNPCSNPAETLGTPVGRWSVAPPGIGGQTLEVAQVGLATSAVGPSSRPVPPPGATNPSHVKPHPAPHRPVFEHDAKPIHRRQGWEVAVSGDLSEKQSDLVEELLKLEPGSWGTLYFDSPGGNVYAGISLASLIRLRRLRATAVVLGECSSAAILPFAACPERYVLPFSTLFFHPVRSSSEEDVQLEEAAEWARHFAIIEEEMDQLLAKFFGRSYEDVRGWSRPGRFFTGREVANLGLARLLEVNGDELGKQITAIRKQPSVAGKNG